MLLLNKADDQTVAAFLTEFVESLNTDSGVHRPESLIDVSSERSPDGAERNPGRHRRLAAIPDYAPLHPGYGPYVVTTWLDPVVHADWPNVRRGLMDCRIKSGNDEALDLVMPGLVPGIHVLEAAKKDVDGRVKCLAWRHPRRVFGDMTDTS